MTCRLLWLCSLALLAMLRPVMAQNAGGLTTDQVRDMINNVAADDRTRAAINAVTNNDIRDLALNRDVTAVDDEIFTFELPTKGITDQESTGRCWLFAGLNLMRQNVVTKYGLDGFEFSQSFLAFHDKLEKANVFLEFIIETRSRDILDRELVHMLNDPVSDGGYWGYVVSIIDKYGVVPKQFMAESKSSANTSRMDYILNTLLRRSAARLRTLAGEGKSVADLRREKAAMLQDVTRVLVISYGEPPASFIWRTANDSGKVSDPVTYTPQEFNRNVVGVDLTQFISVASYPMHPFGRNYSISLTRSMADRPDISFVNVTAAQMKDFALRALLDSNRIWFGCDMGHDVHSKSGRMVKDLYGYRELFGVDLSMDKRQRLDYRHSASNHAMVFTGVDVIEGRPRKWKVENSWGKDRGDAGLFTMSDDWFDEYVLNVIIPKHYLTADVLAAAEQKPIALPVWDPVWRSLGW